MTRKVTNSMTRKDFVAFGAVAGASVALGLAGCAQGSASSASSAASAPQSASSTLESTSASLRDGGQDAGSSPDSGSSQEPSSQQTPASAQNSDASKDADQPQGADASSASQNAATEFAVADKQLASGFSMPAFGLGTWTLADDVAEASVRTAIGCGYRLIDTAQYYGNEEGVGRGVRRAIDEGTVAREDVFVTSKIMPSSFDRAAESIDESLSRLDLGYIDLMLIHQPGSNDEAVWRALEDAVREGKVRSIGISNYYTPEKYNTIADIAEAPVALVQNENHPYYQNTELQAYVEDTGGYVESWYPLGGRPGVAKMLADEVLDAIAAAHGKTVAQTILRWHVQSGYITIPGSSNPDHIAENIQIFDFALTDDDMARIAALNGAGRFENW